MCAENKLYDKGGDIWTGRGLSQGIKHVKSLGMKITLKWKVKGAYLENLTSGTMGGEVAFSNGRQPFSAIKPRTDGNNSARWKGKI